MKDKRYATVKILIEAGHVTSLTEIFDTLPRSVVIKDFGTNYVRFSRLMENPDQFKLKELFTLAKLFDIDEMKMVSLVIYQYKNKVAKKKP
jgi:EAL domain-containing protein (putative c-di-GMP-specific phosphodiesterase class I)